MFLPYGQLPEHDWSTTGESALFEDKAKKKMVDVLRKLISGYFNKACSTVTQNISL